MMIFFGSFAILLWKCGSQLNKEAKYKELGDDMEAKMKAKKNNTSKYAKILYQLFEAVKSL